MQNLCCCQEKNDETESRERAGATQVSAVLQMDTSLSLSVVSAMNVDDHGSPLTPVPSAFYDLDLSWLRLLMQFSLALPNGHSQ